MSTILHRLIKKNLGTKIPASLLAIFMSGFLFYILYSSGMCGESSTLRSSCNIALHLITGQNAQALALLTPCAHFTAVTEWVFHRAEDGCSYVSVTVTGTKKRNILVYRVSRKQTKNLIILKPKPMDA